MTEQIELWQNEQDRSNNIEQLSRYFSDETKTDKVTNIVNYLELNEQTDCGERVNELLSTQLDAMVSHFVGDRSLQARLLELDDDTTRRSLSSPAAISKLRRAVQRYTQYVCYLC
jgi:lipopolysaccharide biosynthesis regulator YciM